MLRFRFDGCQRIVLPPAAQSGRGEDLWQTTCAELFIVDSGGSYREFNFSPSGQWAAYKFAGYRTRTGDYDPVRTPEIAMDVGHSVLTITVFLAAEEFAQSTHVALTAIVEEQRGRQSYWAHHHPGAKPDFHNPACFVLPVP